MTMSRHRRYVRSPLVYEAHGFVGVEHGSGEVRGDAVAFERVECFGVREHDATRLDAVVGERGQLTGDVELVATRKGIVRNGDRVAGELVAGELVVRFRTHGVSCRS